MAEFVSLDHTAGEEAVLAHVKVEAFQAAIPTEMAKMVETHVKSQGEAFQAAIPDNRNGKDGRNSRKKPR